MDQLLLVVALSMLLTPALFILYDKVIAPRYSQDQEREADEMPGGRKIIVAGAGRIGGLVDRMLRAAGYETTVIDYSSKRLDIMAKFGVQNYYGDATRPDLLHAAGIDEARLLIIAIDDREQITELAKYMHETHPHVKVVARAVDRDHVYDLWFHGCREIIRETYDSTLRMGRVAFEQLGIDQDTAQQMVDAFNAKDREIMVAVASVHEVGVPVHENEAYVALAREKLAEAEVEINEQMTEIRSNRPCP